MRLLATAAFFVVLCVAPLSEAKFTCYEGADDEESWLMAESCDDTKALDSLMVACGAASGTIFCETYQDFAGDGVDVLLTSTKRDGNGFGCTGTAPMKKAYSAVHYEKKASTIQCDGFLPIMNYPTPAKCNAEIVALNNIVTLSTDENFDCALTTQTTTATSSATVLSAKKVAVYIPGSLLHFITLASSVTLGYRPISSHRSSN